MLRLSFLLMYLLNLATSALTAVEYSKNDFPPGFLFGASTSAYQVEGAANEDGRTPSIWDTFAHAGNVHGTGDIACDGYHKYKEDVKLMADTGLDAYRFSISWSRLIPNGRGPVNPKGLQYYNNLINELISYGIQPHVTLHHFDLPQALEDEYGGWINRTIMLCRHSDSNRDALALLPKSSVSTDFTIAACSISMNVYSSILSTLECRKDFTAYADVCFRQFGDRVSYWTTVNEPNAFANLGYDYGIAPPQRCSSINHCSRGNSSTEPYITVHHVLLAHASVARLYRKKYQDKQRGYIGVNIFAFGLLPLTNSTEDAIATQRYYDFLIGWMANPLVYGDYPKIMKQNVGSRLPAFSDRESKQVKGSADFLGVINYYIVYVKDNPSSLNKKLRDWNADSATEIFCQNTPRRSSLKDISRVKYLHAYIGSVLDAVSVCFLFLKKNGRNGSNIRGYFMWSFLDVFELMDGYESSYGLYYVDRDDPDLKRYPKLSAHWYSQFLKGRSLSSDEDFALEKNFSGPSYGHDYQ
ncbi:Beta-glucosidase 11 [Citrus sinensis]|uniref:Beta-glucosidase 11 n=1 Tax=Citrus sinensis TaxID=2711 RepID=A0ACB8ML57_CITSI|nr:Beta-glucosidase 11 [Citrus sinensis]